MRHCIQLISVHGMQWHYREHSYTSSLHNSKWRTTFLYKANTRHRSVQRHVVCINYIINLNLPYESWKYINAGFNRLKLESQNAFTAYLPSKPFCIQLKPVHIMPHWSLHCRTKKIHTTIPYINKDLTKYHILKLSMQGLMY